MYAKDTGGWNSPQGWGADVQTILDRMIKLSSVLWNPQMASGKTFPKLDPRTLPNGVKNTDWVQNVSGDVVLQISDITFLGVELSEVNYANVLVSAMSNIINYGSTDGVATKLNSSASTPLNGGVTNSTASVYKHYFSGNNMRVILPKTITNLAQAQALLAGTVIRYQLATPIDKLNSPFVNPLIDLSRGYDVALTNAVVNGDFELQTDWTGDGATVTIADGKASFVGNGSTSSPRAGQLTPMPYALGKKISVTVKSKVTNSVCTSISVRAIATGMTNVSVIAQSSPVINTEYTNTIEMVLTAGGSGNVRFQIAHNYADAATANNKVMEVQEITVIDLTTAFGATKEPLPTDIQQAMTEAGTTFWNGTKTLKFNPNLLLKNFAGTQASGYVDVPCITGRGQAINFKNLLGADGNFPVDSNADGLADGLLTVNVSTKSVSNNVQTFTVSAQYGNVYRPLNLGVSVGDKIYGSCMVLGVGATILVGDGLGNSEKTTVSPSEFSFVSGLYQIQRTIDDAIKVYDNRASGWTPISVKQMIGLNLTTTFGAGNEPSKAKMDELVQTCIKKYGYVNEQVIMIEWVPMLKFDGATSYGMANHPSLDIVGAGDFAIAAVFKPSVRAWETLVAKGSLGHANVQYAVKFSVEGWIEVACGGLACLMVPTPAISKDELVSLLVYRVNGRLKGRIRGVQVYNNAWTHALISKPNFRLGAISVLADGASQTEYSSSRLGHLSIINGAITPFTEADLIAKWDKYCAKTFGI